MITRRQFIKFSAAAGMGAFLTGRARWMDSAQASYLLAQTPLPGSQIPKFVDAMPNFIGARQSGAEIPVEMLEFQQMILPAAVYAPLLAPFNTGTYVWGYNVNNTLPVYPGITIEAMRGIPQRVRYINNLPVSGSEVQPRLSIDQTLHWADPLGLMCHMAGGMPMGDCLLPYQGPPPAVAHLHGSEVPSEFDGGPDQWFTPDGILGPSFRTLDPGLLNGAVYEYPNQQECTTLWFHDHTLGATRINVYSGMAAFYLLRDGWDTGGPDNGPGLPWGNYEVEIALQDRMFDTNGQLYFPDIGINPEHPLWLPEFFGDVVVVNGKSWPFFNVEPRRYRLRLLGGANARFWELRLINRAAKTPGPGIWVIGSDGGLLDQPALFSDPLAAKSPRLLIAPGERYDVIIDFTNYAGQTLTLLNSGKAPFPKGAPADPSTVGQVLEFRVGTTVTGVDDSYNPANPAGRTLRPQPVIHLTTGGAANVVPDVTRQLTLNEVMGAGGPLMVLVNNTLWTGKTPMGDPVGTVPDSAGNLLTEVPQVGATEVWEIVNLTADAHPIHLHLVQFQLINRQNFNLSKYTAAYAALFPGGGIDPMTGLPYAPGVFMGGYGPPLPYASTLKPGGNPDVTPFLQGLIMLPDGKEMGFKDTLVMYPGQVTRIIVRFAPTDIALGATAPGVNAYPFDPTSGPGYVWHCHIVDHEDNEMMRPYNLQL